MADEQTMKDQRDRFLAFAFASADLFIEVSQEGKIKYVLGAAKGLTGESEKNLLEKNWLELFSSYDQAQMQNTFERAKPGLRIGPFLVHMSEKLGERKALITGIKMPGAQNFYITLGLSNALMAKIAQLSNMAQNEELLNRELFTEAAQDIASKAKSMGQDVGLTLFDLSVSEKDKQRIGDEAWGSLRDSVSELLISSSFDGQTAGDLGEGKYTLIHEKNADTDELKNQIMEIAKANDPTGQGLEVSTKSVSSNLKDMDERDASRAILYTIHEFERKGTNVTIETLNSGFEAYVAANAQKIEEFQNFIQRSSFKLHFQPIVDLKTKQASHFEMLCRFDYGNTQEWIMFGEDVGLAPQFDMAVVERAVDYISFKAGGTRTKFSINLSGQSIEDEGFFEKLLQKISGNKDLVERLMFEITESAHITNLDKVADFVNRLRDKGFKVALDDFGAGTASFQYLQKIHVDYVKIDGKYIRKLTNSQRDVAMVRNLSQLCKDLNIKVIAEFVENQEEVDLLLGMEVQYGQGYLFGKPGPNPDYVPPQSANK